jgi:branched-chain amino acid transport system ATP-binding protein
VETATVTLAVRDLVKRYGERAALRGVSLSAGRGELVAVIGPNGAGKTTLFNVVAGDMPATTGRIEIFGSDVSRQPARTRAKLGLARSYQQSRLFLGLTVEDCVYLSIVGVEGGRLRPVVLPRKDAEIRDRARDAARRAAIDGKLGELVGSLSHGEHRQVALAMALAAEPRLLMLDEPASGLSRGERQLLTELLLALDRNITLILIEHDMDIALRVAERVTMMHEGLVIVEGTPTEIRHNELVHDLYLGSRFTEDAEDGRG